MVFHGGMGKSRVEYEREGAMAVGPGKMPETGIQRICATRRRICAYIKNKFESYFPWVGLVKQ
jgi:hypothetical protein